MKDFFERSFNFDKSLINKKFLLLWNKSPYFKILPIVVIHKIFKILAFIQEDYYYHVTDSFNYPHQKNQYIGKCCEIKKNLVKIAYSGWEDAFDEWVPIENLTYLDKNNYPKYCSPKSFYLDILDLAAGMWFGGVICHVEVVNNQKMLTVIYRQKLLKKFFIINNIPISYKYIAPYKRHTSRHSNLSADSISRSLIKNRQHKQHTKRCIIDRANQMGYTISTKSLIVSDGTGRMNQITVS